MDGIETAIIRSMDKNQHSTEISHET